MTSQGFDQTANPQHQKNMYNNNKSYTKNKTGMYNPNQGGTNISPPRHNNQMNIPYGYTGNPQQSEARQPTQNQPQNVTHSTNTMQGFQGMTYPASQQNQNNNSNIKQNMQKGQNMLIHNTPNQNLMYMQQQMDNDDNNNSNIIQKEEKSSETTSEDNITQAQSMASSIPQNPQMAMQPSPMMDSQSQSDTMSTSSNRHSTMTTNANPNQYMQNDMYLPKSFIQQQQYGQTPTNMYG